MPVNNEDLNAGIDPTGFNAITGAQLLQLVTGATPFADKGIVMTTTDIAGIPDVPNALVTVKWQGYFWRRISATSITVYAWSPNQPPYTDPVSQVSLLQWYPLVLTAIAPGSITGSMIAANTIPDSAIIGMSYNKLINAPNPVVVGGVAGGVLAGTYPNPTLANGAVTNLAIGLQAIDLATQMKVTGVWNPLQNVRVNNAGTGLEAVTKLITQIPEPVIGNANQLVAVNNAGNGFGYTSPQGVGRILQEVMTTDFAQITGTTQLGISGLPAMANGTAIPNLNIAFTPLSAASTLFIEALVYVGLSTGVLYGTLALGSGGANAIAVSTTPYTGSTAPNQMVLRHKLLPGSIALINFSLVFGGGNTDNVYYNGSTTGGALYGGGIVFSSLRITEYL